MTPLSVFLLRGPHRESLMLRTLNAGANPELSNQARWMNHASGSDANVSWKKQRQGPQPAMHFYTTVPIRAGDELCFDYGDEYWAALGETPV